MELVRQAEAFEKELDVRSAVRCYEVSLPLFFHTASPLHLKMFRCVQP